MPNKLHFKKDLPMFYARDYFSADLQSGMFAKWFKALILWASCNREIGPGEMPIGCNPLVQFIFFVKPLQLNKADDVLVLRNREPGFYIDIPEHDFFEICNKITDALFADNIDDAMALDIDNSITKLYRHVIISTYTYQTMPTNGPADQVGFTNNELHQIWLYFAQELQDEGYNTEEYIRKVKC